MKNLQKASFGNTLCWWWLLHEQLGRTGTGWAGNTSGKAMCFKQARWWRRAVHPPAHMPVWKNQHGTELLTFKSRGPVWIPLYCCSACTLKSTEKQLLSLQRNHQMSSLYSCIQPSSPLTSWSFTASCLLLSMPFYCIPTFSKILEAWYLT